MAENQLKIEELLSRGVDEVIDKHNLKKELLSDKKLNVKLGIDPTSPHIHIGHSILLLKLKDFQQLGHKIHLIIGDFTGTIGDTSDKDAVRPMLAAKKVKANAKTYLDQIAKIIDVKKAEVHYNSKWLAALNLKEISKQADAFSLAEFIARKNIKKRLDLKKRISLRELIYPLMQGYDSVAIEADVEIGGTDQRFNLLAGRQLQQLYKQKPQDILTTNLIVGLDGRKMRATYNNTVNLTDEPQDMFGKIMSISDDLIIPYFIHCTRVALDKITDYQQQIKEGTNPRDIKLKLAYAITKLYCKEEGASEGKKHFQTVFQNKEVPDDIVEKKISSEDIISALVETELAPSKSEAGRLIKQGGVKINQEIVKSEKTKVKKGDIVQKGKREFVKIK